MIVTQVTPHENPIHSRQGSFSSQQAFQDVVSPILGSLQLLVAFGHAYVMIQCQRNSLRGEKRHGSLLWTILSLVLGFVLILSILVYWGNRADYPRLINISYGCGWLIFGVVEISYLSEFNAINNLEVSNYLGESSLAAAAMDFCRNDWIVYLSTTMLMLTLAVQTVVFCILSLVNSNTEGFIRLGYASDGFFILLVGQISYYQLELFKQR
jgi:hypothetical protein